MLPLPVPGGWVLAPLPALDLQVGRPGREEKRVAGDDAHPCGLSGSTSLYTVMPRHEGDVAAYAGCAARTLALAATPNPHRHRCLILADGFYEWKRGGKRKVPYRIALKTEEPFAFAGIWSLVHDAQGVVQPTFALLTTEANPLVAQIHTRMPVILREQDEADWLTPTLALDAAQALLVPYPAERLMAYEVSSRVNAATSNSPDLLRPRV